jgi:zinc/manganese transport system substrate-binding protein
MLIDMSFRRPAALSPRFGVAVAALAAVAFCSACGSSGGGGGGDDGVSVVASTNVYGDLVATIAGSAVEVTSIISDPDQDPHSYEADAKSQLALKKADLVIQNGGGYDDFVGTMLDNAGGDATVLNVVDISGRDTGDGELNEHVWYDLPTMAALVDRIVEELSRLDADAAATFTANGDALKGQIEGLEAEVDQIARTAGNVQIAITEPVPLYLLEACGFSNQTPEAFSEAVEEGADVSPRDLQAMLAVLGDGTVRILAYNEQTSGPETQQVLAAAKSAGIAVIPVRETLPAGGHYVAWMSGYLTQIKAALAA